MCWNVLAYLRVCAFRNVDDSEGFNCLTLSHAFLKLEEDQEFKAVCSFQPGTICTSAGEAACSVPANRGVTVWPVRTNPLTIASFGSCNSKMDIGQPNVANSVEKKSIDSASRGSRAGRSFLAIGDWWKMPARLLGHRDLMPQGYTSESTCADSAGWEPAFNKTVHGSGLPSKRRSAKSRAAGVAKRITFGAAFMKASAISHASPLAPSVGAESSLSLSTHHDMADALEAVRLDEVAKTPTRRVLDTTLASDTS
jgi:hypothetical protein